MNLTVDTRKGVQNKDITIFNASDDLSIQWLKKLDGNRHTLLFFERIDGVQLMVGGGPENFIVTLNDGIEDRTLKNPSGRHSKVIEVCAGGQFGEYSEGICVQFDQAQNSIIQFIQKYEEILEWKSNHGHNEV